MRGTPCARILTPMTDANQAARKALHWADSWADAIIRERGDLDAYTCSAGITPSGTVHIGNFREIISADLVVRALRDRGKNAHCPPAVPAASVSPAFPAEAGFRRKAASVLRKMPIPIANEGSPYRTAGSDRNGI